MPEHQRGRQLPTLEQGLRPINIGDDRIEQMRALRHATLDMRPLGLADQERQQVERPRPRLAVIRVDVVTDVVIADLLRDRSVVILQSRDAVFAEPLEELPPRFAQRA